METFAVHDLFGVARKCCSAVFGVHVELLGVRPEVVGERLEGDGANSPFVPGSCFVEEGMHDFYGFVGKSVGFDDAWHCRL